MSELKFKGTARCVWVELNNGVVKAVYEPEPAFAGIELLMFNLHKDRGVPERGKLYWIEIQPAFPHDAE